MKIYLRTIVSVFLLLFIINPGYSQASKPAFYNDIEAFKKQDAANPPPANAIVFAGSSSFTKWTDVQSYFPNYKIINRGFGGSTLPDLIRYTDDVIINYHPKQVVIYCGENDLASSDTVTGETVVKRFEHLFKMIRDKLPSAQIAFISLKPSPSRERLFPKMIIANNGIKAFLSRQKATTFIDVYPLMLDANGKARRELFVEDMLHMNKKGYEIWQKEIAPHLLK
jgi:lysophospholipase L1-like esterase